MAATDVGWTMGYMTEKSNQIEAVEAKQLLSLPAFTSLIVLFCLFFIIGCLMTYHAFQMNQTSDSYNRLIFRSVLSLLRFVVLDIFLSSLWFFLFHFRIGGGRRGGKILQASFKDDSKIFCPQIYGCCFKILPGLYCDPFGCFWILKVSFGVVSGSFKIIPIL